LIIIDNCKNMRFFFIVCSLLFFSLKTEAQVNDPLWDRINLTGAEAKLIDLEPEKVKKAFPLWIPLAGGALTGGIIVLTSGDGGGGTEPPDLPPINAVNDRLEIPCDGSGSINILSNDTGQGLQVQSFSNTTGLDFQHDGAGLITVSNPGSGSFTFSYSITDREGQVATAVVTIIGTDDVAPQLECPDDVIIDCGSPTNPSVIGQPSITDNCDPAPTLIFSDEERLGACPFVKTIERTFEGTDAAGNSSNCTQTILIKDEDAPIIRQNAQDLILDCGSVDNEALTEQWLENNGGAQAEDACGSTLTWTHNLEEIPASVGSVPVTFTVTDSCGNASETTAQLLIEDTSPPVLQAEAADLLIECGSDIDAMILDWLDKNGGALAEDACGSFTWSNDFPGSVPSCELTQVTFIATDEAGNAVSTTAGVSILDMEPPSYICPPNITLDAGQDPTPDNAGFPAEIIDNCSDEVRGFFEDEVITQTDGLLILRTWTLIDFCGNASSCVQEIIVPGLNCDFPLTADITQPSSPTASDGVIIVNVPPEAPPPPYTLIVNGEATPNIPSRQINLAGRGVGEYTITVVVDENCQSETITLTLSADSPGLQEVKAPVLDLDFSGLQPFGAYRPLLMENELSRFLDDWLSSGIVEHPTPATKLTYDWMTYGKNAVQVRMPFGNRQEVRLRASQFQVMGEGIAPGDGKILDLRGTGFEIALHQRLTLANGKARPYIEGALRTGAYQLQQGQVQGQNVFNPQVYFPFWMMSFSSGLQWRPSEELELNLKEEWLGSDLFFIGLEVLLNIE
jgi:hypothetical protein